jgi:hypothetical protein
MLKNLGENASIEQSAEKIKAEHCYQSWMKLLNLAPNKCVLVAAGHSQSVGKMHRRRYRKGRHFDHDSPQSLKPTFARRTRNTRALSSDAATATAALHPPALYRPPGRLLQFSVITLSNTM